MNLDIKIEFLSPHKLSLCVFKLGMYISMETIYLDVY